MTDENIDDKFLNEYFVEASFTRSHIIGRTVILESMIDIFLSTHFCQTEDSQNEIMEIIFGTLKISFDSKRDAMNAIMQKHHKDFLIENKNFNKDIQDIIKERNIFAHYPLYDYDKGLELFNKDRTVSFLKFRNSKEYLHYSKQDIKNLFNKINHNTKLLSGLLETMT